MKVVKFIKTTVFLCLCSSSLLSHATQQINAASNTFTSSSDIDDSTPPVIQFVGDGALGGARTINNSYVLRATVNGFAVGVTDATQAIDMSTTNSGSLIGSGGVAINVSGANIGNTLTLTNTGNITGNITGPDGVTIINVDGGTISGAITGNAVAANIFRVGNGGATVFSTGGVISNFPTIAISTSGT